MYELETLRTCAQNVHRYVFCFPPPPPPSPSKYPVTLLKRDFIRLINNRHIATQTNLYDLPSLIRIRLNLHLD